jgi:hypothetical protein
VAAGGVVVGAVVGAGGTRIVSAGGLDISGLVGSGGLEFISSAGVISGGTLISGAKLTVLSGGGVTGGLVLSGGTAVVSGIAAAGQAVTFIGSGGDLALFNPAAFAAMISGFGPGDMVDLGAIPYGSAVTRAFIQAAGSGTLTVTGAGQSATLTLLGAYATSNFTLSSDGAGGTFVKFI